MDIAVGVLRVEDGRSTGQRFVHGNVLKKVVDLMNDLGEREIALAAKRWLDGGSKVPKGTALAQARKKADAHHEAFLSKGMPREAAYCELAAFCVQACMEETA